MLLNTMEGTGSMRPALIAVFALGVAGCVTAPAGGAFATWTDGVKFTPMGQGSGAFSATIDGSTTAAAPYAIRVHITKGGKIAPHTHPDTRFITVVAGELCYGFGETFDETACKVYPAGSTFVVPGGKPHFGVGRSEAVYQESGFGPSAFVPVPAK
jgi:quercetin dioxygenase-like cupin family protein